jgi:hypothetical protein
LVQTAKGCPLLPEETTNMSINQLFRTLAQPKEEQKFHQMTS